jgi:hypothetical protein
LRSCPRVVTVDHGSAESKYPDRLDPRPGRMFLPEVMS